MKREIIGIFVMTLMIATFVMPVAGYDNVKSTNINNLSYNDAIDQQQTVDEIGVPVSSVADMAQSFKPTKEMLTRVKIKLEKTGSPDDITLSIRDDLNSDDLIWETKSSGEIPAGPSWVDFDFPDISVTPGNTYYIVCEKENDWAYLWRWSDDIYSSGEVFISSNGYDWETFSIPLDFCFVTWGKS